jgi:hypothetical protein
VQKVWSVQYGDSTINLKAEVLPEAEAEGPQQEKKKKKKDLIGTTEYLTL